MRNLHLFTNLHKIWLGIIISLPFGLTAPLQAEKNSTYTLESSSKDSRVIGLDADITEVLSQELLYNLDNIKYIFQVKYAPKAWKFEFNGWDLNQQIKIAKESTLSKESLNLDDCRQILSQFMNSCCDYHVKMKFHSTEFSYLPFRVKSSQGRYFVTWIDEMLMVGREMELKVGDEITQFDGRPVAEAIKELRSRYFNRDMPLTDYALSEIFLTLRIGADGLIPQKGSIALQARREETVVDGMMDWFYHPEEIAPLTSSHIKNSKSTQSRTNTDFIAGFHKQYITPLYQSFVDVSDKIKSLHASPEDIIDDEFIPFGNHKSYVPVLGKVVWKSSKNSPFHAYIFEHPITKKSIGYVRIPHFSVMDSQPAKKFLNLIDDFEDRTDALVIDQVANPGGDLLYLYALASILADKPLEVASQRFTLTQESVNDSLWRLNMLKKIDSVESAREIIGSSISGYRVDMKLVKGLIEHFQFIVDQWNVGNTLTDPFYLYNIHYIEPHRFISYSKPILMLIDNLDFSSADFLPALLQDNQRATLFGVRTAGAGGYVEDFTYPNLLGIHYFTYTGSIAKRLNGLPIENLGVTPDILYEPTPDDLQNGYQGYGSAVNQALELLTE